MKAAGHCWGFAVRASLAPSGGGVSHRMFFWLKSAFGDKTVEKSPAADYCQLFQMIDNMERSLSSLLNAVTLPSQPITSAPVCCPHHPTQVCLSQLFLVLWASWVSTKGLCYPTLDNGTATALRITSTGHSWEFWPWRGSTFTHCDMWLLLKINTGITFQRVSTWQVLISWNSQHLWHAGAILSATLTLKAASFLQQKLQKGLWWARWWALTGRGLDSAGECVELLAAHKCSEPQKSVWCTKGKSRKVQSPTEKCKCDRTVMRNHSSSCVRSPMMDQSMNGTFRETETSYSIGIAFNLLYIVFFKNLF